jgi:hypothetical protein
MTRDNDEKRVQLLVEVKRREMFSPTTWSRSKLASLLWTPPCCPQAPLAIVAAGVGHLAIFVATMVVVVPSTWGWVQ